jgi:hypothetical protein
MLFGFNRVHIPQDELSGTSAIQSRAEDKPAFAGGQQLFYCMNQMNRSALWQIPLRSLD